MMLDSPHTSAPMLMRGLAPHPWTVTQPSGCVIVAVLLVHAPSRDPLLLPLLLSVTQSPSPPRSLVCDGQTTTVHTVLGLSTLVAHVLHHPPPHTNSFIISTAVIDTHTEEQSLPSDGQSSSIEDQPQCRGMCHSSRPSACSLS